MSTAPGTRGSMDKRGYDFSRSLEKKTFNFGPRNPEALSVDASLAGLFDCLTMECSGILVHPQWKHFRHIQMLKNDQTRLSNGIWRSWHIQFQKGRRPLFCWFDIDAKLDHHNRPEAVVLEGKYWKRNKDAVAREYRKWRLFYYKQQRILKLGQVLANHQDSASNQNLDDMRNWPQTSQMDTTFVNYFQSDGTAGLMDTLLFDTTVPFTRTSLDTDIMQPNLDMLNPTLDELLDHLEPMDVTFARSTASGFFGTPNTFSTVAALSMLSGPSSRTQPPRGGRQQQNILSDVLQMPLPGSSLGVYDQYGNTMSAFVTPQGFPQKVSPAPRLQLVPASFIGQMQGTLQQQQQQEGGYTQEVFPSSHRGLRDEYPLSPTSFLRLSSLEEAKDTSDASMELGDTQQFISFALKPEPISDEGVSHSCSAPLTAPLTAGQFRPLDPSVPQSSQSAPGGSGALGLAGPSSLHSSVSDYQRSLPFSSQLRSPIGQQPQPLALPKPATIQYTSHQFSSQTPPPPPPEPMAPSQTPFARTQYPSQYSPQHSRSGGAPHPPPDSIPPSLSASTSFARIPAYSPQHTQTLPSSCPTSNIMAPPSLPTTAFPRVLSSESLPSMSNTTSHPPLERGTSEPTRSLQAQVRMLTEQHEEQMKEIDRQRGLAQLQYNQVLEQYLKHSSEQTSQQQQQILQSVLADPNLVNILKSVLLSGQDEGGKLVAKEEVGGSEERAVVSDATKAGFLRTKGGPPARPEEFGLSPPPPPSPAQANLLQLQKGAPLPPPAQANLQKGAPPPQSKQLVPAQTKLTQLQQSAPLHTLMVTSSAANLAHLVCPTEFAKATGISDFQSRLLVAAAQASSSDSPATPTSALSTSSRPSYSSETDIASSPSVVQRRLKNPKQLTSEEKIVYKELRRQSHISAEQKRRGSIKQGFDHLQSLLINPATYPTGKVSKTAILEKCIEYIEDSHQKRLNRDKKIEALRKEISQLNKDISDFQQTLPASGAPITRQRFEENRQRFREYVQRKTLQNYKFWIFSIILQQLFDSYNALVATGSSDELCRTVLTWFEQRCSLPSLRPVVFSSLKELSLKTSILSDPSQVPQQLKDYASQRVEEQESGNFAGLQ